MTTAALSHVGSVGASGPKRAIKMRRLEGEVLRARMMSVLVGLLAIQVCHYLFFSKEPIGAIATVFLTGTLLIAMLAVVSRKIPNGDLTIPVNLWFFQLIYLGCFVVTIVFSRYAYIASFQLAGLLETREAGLGGGGITSLITIWFYPLGILLAFLRIPSRRYLILLIPLLIMMVIDMVALGTRNIPFFVLLFHILASNRKLLTVRGVIFAIVTFAAIIALVDYQTKGRSLNTTTVGFDWSRTLQLSRTFDKVPIKDEVIEASGQWSAVGPLVYFTNYISHSQAEFKFLIEQSSYNAFGTPDYTLDEFCLVLRCDRAPYQTYIAHENPSLGLYMTLFSVPLFDYGYLGTAIIIFLSGTLLFVLKPETTMPLLIFLGVVIVVGPVDNYVYNGLGLARFMLFAVVWHGCAQSARWCLR